MTATAHIGPSRFDLSWIRVRPRTLPTALEQLEQRVAGAGMKGELIACLYAEIGVVNMIMLLRRYSDIGALLSERDALANDGGPLGVSEFVLDMATDVCAALPGVAPALAAGLGPLYEVRTDTVRTGRFPQALAGARNAIRDSDTAPMLVLYSLIGDAPRIFRIRSGTGLDQQAADHRPASDCPVDTRNDDFVARRADIFRAASFSPIR